MHTEEQQDDQMELMRSTDAHVWASRFCARFGPKGSIHQTPIDDGLMIGWFANAMMVQYDERTRTLGDQRRQELLDYAAFLSTQPPFEKIVAGHFVQSLADWEIEKQRRYDLEYNKAAESGLTQMH